MIGCEKLDGNIELPRGEIVADDIHGVPEQIVRVGFSQMQLQFPARDAGQVEQIIDEAGLELDVAANHLQAFANFRRKPGLVHHSSGPDQNGSKWRAQFVTEIGEEAVFRGVGGLGDLFLAVKFFFDLAAMDKQTNLAAQRFHER